jgi:hypothetical protein
MWDNKQNIKITRKKRDKVEILKAMAAPVPLYRSEKQKY